jgi:hypothetical protein
VFASWCADSENSEDANCACELVRKLRDSEDGTVLAGYCAQSERVRMRLCSQAGVQA